MLWRCHADFVIPWQVVGQSFFHFKHFSILQQAKGLKVTTDACVLGAIASHPAPLKCLDIGAGTGILSLMLAQKFPQLKIDAVEIEKAVAEQARINFANSPFSSRIQCRCEDFFDSEFNTIYDIIVSNPPYFSQHLNGQRPEKNTAIHNRSMPMDHLLKKVYRLLDVKGLFWIIYPPYEMKRFRELAEAENLYCQTELMIYNLPGRHFRTICCFSKQNTECVRQDLSLHLEDGSRTDAFSELMQSFYLEKTDIYKKKKTINK